MRFLGLPGLLRMLDMVSERRYAQHGLAVLRIGYGVLVLMLIGLNWGERDLLWGPEGAYDMAALTEHLEDRSLWSVFALATTSTALDVMLLLMAALAVALVLGWRTRGTAFLMWVFFFSLYFRTPVLPDGGDNIMRIVLVFLPLTDCGAVWSLDARRRDRRARRSGRPHYADGAGYRILTALHNTALAAIIYQVLVVYVASALFKVQGDLWQNGTAVYYPLRVANYNPFPALSEMLWDSTLVVVAATYGTVLLQLAFPLAMLTRPTRRIALLSVLGLHGGIGLVMGLPLFSASVVVTEAVLVSDRSWQSAVAGARAAAVRLTRRAPGGAALLDALRRPPPVAAAARPR